MFARAKRDYELLSGDLLGFSGNGSVSRMIKVGTCSRYSHVAGVVNVRDKIVENVWLKDRGTLPWYDRYERESNAGRPWPENRLTLFESTTLATSDCLLMGKPVRGVQAHEPYSRIEEYDGKVWQFRLAPGRELQNFEEDKLARYLIKQVGVPYNDEGAILSGTRFLKYLILRSPDVKRQFCDALWADSLQLINRFPLSNASTYNPKSFLAEVLDCGIYQLVGRIK